MDFDVTDDQQMLAQTVRDYASKSSPVARFRRMRDDDIGWEPKEWKQMGELGWLSVPFPESAGGFGGSFVEVGLVLQELGKELVPEPYLPSVVLGGLALLEAGSSAQHERFLGPMIAGDVTLALAYAERDGRYDVASPATEAERSGDGWTLSGEKVWVLGGHQADHLIVSAAAPGGTTLFVVDPDTDGLRVHRVGCFDGHKAAFVELHGVQVADDRRLGDEGSGAEVLDRVVDYGATAAVCEGLGICQRVLDMTTEYLKTREQFGVKIGVFQALQHRAVDMFVETELLRSIAMEAMVEATDDDAQQRRAAVSAAKYQLATGGRWVTEQGIQLHGGIGVTDEHDVGLYFKRLQALLSLFGDADHHVRRFAAQPGFFG